MKRIYFCGSHSCGKTTLIMELVQRHGFRYIGETARDIIVDNDIDLASFASDATAADNFQREVLERHVALHQLAALGKQKVMLFDRGPDSIVYSSMFATIATEQHNSSSFKEYIESLRHQDAVLFLLDPSEKMCEEDGVRKSIDMTTLVSITNTIAAFLEWNDIRYIRLTSDNLLTRIKNVEAVLWHKNIIS